MLVDAEYLTRENRRLARLLKQAGLRIGDACVEDISATAARGLDKATLRRLASLDWLSQRMNVLVTGATGVGKSYLACALGQLACRRGHKVLYRRLPRLFEEVALVKADGTYSRLLAKMGRLATALSAPRSSRVPGRLRCVRRGAQSMPPTFAPKCGRSHPAVRPRFRRSCVCCRTDQMKARERRLCVGSGEPRVIVGALMACALSLLGCVACPNPARAQAVELHYSSPSVGCPDARWFRTEVMARLQRDPFREHASVRVDVDIAQVDSGHEARIVVTRDGAELGGRTLADGDCRELASSLALSVVLMLEDVAPLPPEDASRSAAVVADAHSVTDASNGEADLDRASAAPIATTDSHAAPPSAAGSSNATHDRVRPELGLDLGVGAGVEPHVAGLASVSIGAGAASWGLRLDLRGALPETAGDEAARARIALLGVALHACVRRKQWRVCALGEVSALRASRRGSAVARTALAYVPAVGPEVALRVPLARSLALRGRLELSVPLRRPEVVAGEQALWRASWIRGALWLGLELRLDKSMRTDPRP